MEALLAVTSVYEAMKNKLSYIERRSMNENLKPWEAVRQIQEVFVSVEPAGDAGWVLRTVRDICLLYLRAISQRYASMKSEEMLRLVQLVVFEACKRHVMSIVGDEKAREKYALTIELCEAMEDAEDSICQQARIFTLTSLRIEVVEQGYESNVAYDWIKKNASIAAKFEMQTVLRENYEKVKKVKETILQAHGIEPAAKRQKNMTDPCSSNPNSAEPEPAAKRQKKMADCGA